MVAGSIIVLTTAAVDIGGPSTTRPSSPTMRSAPGGLSEALQQTGTISDRGKILIERAADWGDLAIVAIANRPERFVLLDEVAYQELSTTLGRA